MSPGLLLCIGGLLPSDDGVNNIIALAWTDLYPPGGGQISYETRGSAPNRRLIISYTAVPWCCEVGVDRVTSQVILYERRSLIEIHTTHQDAEHIYTQGVENADGTVAAFLSGRMAADYGLVNDAVRFRHEVGRSDCPTNTRRPGFPGAVPLQSKALCAAPPST